MSYFVHDFLVIINGSASHSLSTLWFTANTNASTFSKANKDAVEEAYYIANEQANSKCEYHYIMLVMIMIIPIQFF